MSTRKQRQMNAAKHLTDKEKEAIWCGLGHWYDEIVTSPADDELSPQDVLELMTNICPDHGHWLQNRPTRWGELDDDTIKELTERRDRREKIIAEAESLNR
jgi:hypothetical protein